MCMLYLIPSQLPVQHSAYSLLRSMCSIQIRPVFSPYCSHYGILNNATAAELNFLFMGNSRQLSI